MTGTSVDPPSSSFVLELRKALHYLYDWATLCKSPLVELFGTTDREDPSSTLRCVLTDAIESLKPNAGVPSRAHAWGTHQVLYSRYVEQFAQKETAAELGLSVRQIRREESIALEALASYLWRHYDLESKWRDETDIPSPVG